MLFLRVVKLLNTFLLWRLNCFSPALERKSFRLGSNDHVSLHLLQLLAFSPKQTFNLLGYDEFKALLIILELLERSLKVVEESLLFRFSLFFILRRFFLGLNGKFLKFLLELGVILTQILVVGV